MNPMLGRWAVLYKGTAGEMALEPAVAALGVPYRTNFPCFLYSGGLKSILDFYLPTLKMVIEVDGESHNTKAAQEADASRTAELEKRYGVKVYRVSNEDALRDNIKAVNQVMIEADLPLRVTQCLSTVEHVLPPRASKPPRKRKQVRRVKSPRRVR